MVFKLFKFIFSIVYTVVGAIFSVEFDGIPLWSITLFVLILVAFIKIVLGPITSGEQPIVMIRDKGYLTISNDNPRTYNFYKPTKWRR